MRNSAVKACFVLITIFAVPFCSFAQTSILTHHYDNARTGQNTNEKILTLANVNSTTFGKLFTLAADGYVYAQPLYVPALAIPGQGTHNVLFIATEHDSLYAYDADNGALLWFRSFLINGATTLSTNDVGGTGDIHPELGITGTPAIDPTTNTMYVVVNTKEAGVLVYRLHAVDITTGQDKLGGPVVLSGSVPGTAKDGNGTTVPFIVQWENQRSGLLLYNGFLFIAFASHGDNSTWHGWILGYNATTLAQTGIWNTSPNGKGDGIWMSGAGIAVDAAGNAFVATGNGDDTVTIPAPPPSTTIDYGDSIVKVSLANGIPLPIDYFTPYNQSTLDGADADVASGGVLIPPDQGGPFPHILIQVGKQGAMYVINRDTMTNDGSHYCNGCTSDPEIIQTVTGSGGLWSIPSYWNGNVYTWGNGSHLKAYSLIAGRLSTTQTSESAETSAFPGSTVAISSNGTADGIVWAVESDAYTSNGPAILRAYKATDVATLLYASNLASGDTLGPAVKFVVPVVTNGRVYVGAQSEVDVFGLLSSVTQAAAPVLNPPAGSYDAGITVAMTTSTPGASIYYTTDGTIPSKSSNLYSTPIPVSVTTTLTAITITNGFTPSEVTTAAYVIASQTAPPTFNPAPGSYVAAQTVSLLDGTSGAQIYYTTDGSIPTHASKLYSAPFAIAATTTVRAIASATPLSDSGVVTGVFNIVANGTLPIDFGSGFSNLGCLVINGATKLDDSRLQLTDSGTNETASAFCKTQVDVRGFITDFTFQLSDADADGITFTLQNSAAGPDAIGPGGGGLGFGADKPTGTGGISNSIAIKFDLYSNNGEGDDSTGLYINGASPTTPSITLNGSGIDLHAGNTIAAHITYDGTNLVMTLTDASAGATYTHTWPIDIPTTIGGTLAYAGFTGGTGGLTASQKIETWTFVSSVPLAQQWTVVTTSETAPNATVLTDATGKPFSCAGQNPDNSGDANANCYNPLVVTTDWRVPTIPGGGTLAMMLANSFTNSSCSSQGNVTNIGVTGYKATGAYSAVITVTLDGGATITFTGASSTNANQFSGTFTSTGSCMKANSGSFAATMFPTVAGSYLGSFESTKGGAASGVQLALSTDWKFNVTGTITPMSGAPVCFSKLTLGTALANTFGPSIASGDVIEAIGSDAAGNVVVFVASNTDANALVLPSGGLYVTYIGVAGACTGVSGTDVPFRKIIAHHHGERVVPNPPAAPKHAPVRRFGTEHFFQRAQPNKPTGVHATTGRAELERPER